MKIALFQTPWSDASHREFKGIAKRYALYPPLGLMHLAAAVEQAGHSADVYDLEVETKDGFKIQAEDSPLRGPSLKIVK